MEWHSSDKESVLEEVGSSEEGLSQKEADERLEKHGENKIEKGDSVSPLKIFIGQFQDTLIYLLILAALVSVGVGFLPGHSPEYTDAALIMLILIANGVFGFIQDYRAEKSIEALKDLSTPDATVIREGEKKTVDSTEVVPGDILVIEQGDAIPADARIIESQSLSTDESALTGESQKVSKEDAIFEEETALADRKNMVFKNTTAVKGRGKAVVVETGMDTQVGGIASQIEEADDKKTPFQEEVDQLGKKIGYGIMAVIALVAMTQLGADYLGPSEVTIDTLVTVLLVSITLAVAAVPEGLPAVVTLTLALGSKKMLKKDALVRSLPVVESLGSVDVIVTDKTGTLTEGTMTVKKMYYQGENIEVTGTGTSTEGEFRKDGHQVESSYLESLLEIGYLCNNAERAPEDDKKDFFGDPTEVALKVASLKSGLEFEEDIKREIPFSSDRKRMTVISGNDALMKGAPEVVLERCDSVLQDGEEVELTDERRQKIIEKNEEFASDALRVLGFARKKVEDVDADSEEIESGMTFVGLQGMIDPPRDEVKGAVDDCREAGIRVVMATGDNLETAKAIGEQIGFKSEGAMEGTEVENLSDKELQEKVEGVEIFARVSPEHKVRILQALQENGHNVAMTGDGVNDAPALKNSDVGIAMGQRGTDVAQQSSDMVLQDDNFVTIRDAIEEGRGIFDNIRKFVNYLLSANAGEVLVVFFGVIIGSFFFQETFSGGNSEALILTPIMLLWINLVTDGLPALALGADPASEGIMKRPPRGKDDPVINRRIMASIIGIGLVMTAAGLPLFFKMLENSLVQAQTVLFTFLVSVEMVRIQTIRRRYGQSLMTNKWLIAALGSSLALQGLVLYTPLKDAFGTYAVGLEGWGLVVAGTAVFTGLTFLLGSMLDRFME